MGCFQRTDGQSNLQRLFRDSTDIQSYTDKIFKNAFFICPPPMCAKIFKQLRQGRNWGRGWGRAPPPAFHTSAKDMSLNRDGLRLCIN